MVVDFSMEFRRCREVTESKFSVLLGRPSGQREQTLLGTSGLCPLGFLGCWFPVSSSGSRNALPHLAGLPVLFTFQSLCMFVSYHVQGFCLCLEGGQGDVCPFHPSPELQAPCTVLSYHFLWLCQKFFFPSLFPFSRAQRVLFGTFCSRVDRDERALREQIHGSLQLCDFVLCDLGKPPPPACQPLPL